jgi:transposase
LLFRGLRGRHARRFVLIFRRSVMQVIYERCAAVDVGKDVIAVAIRMPGDGPGGRVTVRRMYKTFYGVLREAAKWLMSEGVTHVAMEATGIYSMPVYHALLEHGDFEKVLVCNAGHVKNVPGRKTDLLTEPRGVTAAQRTG